MRGFFGFLSGLNAQVATCQAGNHQNDRTQDDSHSPFSQICGSHLGLPTTKRDMQIHYNKNGSEIQTPSLQKVTKGGEPHGLILESSQNNGQGTA
jgi:hypothetical protein